MTGNLSKPVQKLLKWSKAINIAEELDADELAKIGHRVVREYEIDKTSRSDWENQMQMAMKVARQTMEEKTHPWPGAANVRYPLITTAALQFAARAYPEIIKDGAVVKAKVVGEDPDGSKDERAERVSQHMSWQCTEEMDEWDEDMDRLLHVLPVMGICYKKTYFDPLLDRNASPLKLPDKVVVHYKTKSLETARRITEEFQEYNNGIVELTRSGQWLEQDLGPAQDKDHPGDDDAPHDFLEQHRWLDLDDDGYEEPYIVTVHKMTNKVMRIVARYDEESIQLSVDTKTGKHEIAKIDAIQYYTKFSFIPAPDGSFYDIGFGLLLNSLNESVNTLINQLLDAGSLANRQGGFVTRGVKFGKKQSGPLEFRLGEWKHVDVTGATLRDSIVPLPIQGPSPVLFQLLGLLIEAAKELSSVKDVLTGQTPGSDASPTTTLALIEQGIKVFVGIYKRIYRSLAKEFKKLFRLNSIYSNPEVQFRVLDVPYKVFQGDYNVKHLDVVPVADPNLSTDIQRLAKAQAILQVSGRPGLNEYKVTETYIDALQIPNKGEILIPEDKLQPPGPDPTMMKIQADAQVGMAMVQVKQAELSLNAQKLQMEANKVLAEIEKMRADGILSLSKAQAIGMEQGLERLKLFLESLDKETERMHEMRMAREEMHHEHIQGHLDRQQEAALEATRQKNAQSITNE